MNRIKEVLAERGIKHIWLANWLGKTYNMVNGYVSNKRQPSIEVLYEIAKLLQVDAKELLKLR
jgi:transcriptional regulator with XRE-family HTH domain